MRPTYWIWPLLLAFTLDLQASTIYVNASSTPGGDGSSWLTAFDDLQDALAVAQSGDEIWVAAGVYKPTDGLDRTISFELVSGVAMYGGFDATESSLEQRDWVANETVLSGDIGTPNSSFYEDYQALLLQGLDENQADEILRNRWGSPEAVDLERGTALATDNSYHVVLCVGTIEGTILDGVTVTRGDSASRGGGIQLENAALELNHCNVRLNHSWSAGGGINGDSNSRLRVADSIIFGNASEYIGGGIAISGPELVIERSVIQGNHAWYNAAGVAGSGSLVDVEFVENRTDEAAAALGWGPHYLERVTFKNNGCTGTGGGIGQSIVLGNGTMVDVVFENNTVGAGYAEGAGGFFGSGTLINVQFIGNFSTAAGAVRATGPTTIVNGLFANNRGELGALYVGTHYGGSDAPIFSGTVEILNSTFVGNARNAVLSRYQEINLKNSIVLGPALWDSPAAPYNPSMNRSWVSFSNSLVENSHGSGPGWNPDAGIDGGFNIDLPPYFVDPGNGDYRLQPGSPGVDQGSSGLLPPNILTDLAGNPRIYGAAVDMGAYELQVPNCADFVVTLGQSWDSIPLQQVFDQEYGPGAIDVLDDYEGAHCGDAAIPYWFDSSISAWIARVITGNGSASEFGWYQEDFSLPTVDGLIFVQGSTEGQSAVVELPGGPARFGFYLHSTGDPVADPERFFTNRQLNDDGDPQCLIYDITSLRGGKPTYVLAWEDLDAGNPITPTPQSGATDNDYQDLVVEIQAVSPVPVVELHLAAVREAHGVRLQWEIPRLEFVKRLRLMRRRDGRETMLLDLSGADLRERREYLDVTFDEGTVRSYWLEATVGEQTVSSEELAVETPVLAQRSGMLRAQPNPFNPSTQLVLVNEREGEVRLRIYDAAGRLVRTLALGELPAGVQSVEWDGRDDHGASLSSGVYAVSVGRGKALKVVLVK